MVKQSWETTQSNSYKHFLFISTWILLLRYYVLSEQDSTALRRRVEQEDEQEKFITLGYASTNMV